VDERLARDQHRLGGDVDEPADPRRRACGGDVTCAVDVHALELRPGAGILDLRGAVKRERAARRAGLQRGPIGQVTPHGLGPARANRLCGAIRAGERPDLVAGADERLDQLPSDETGSTGDEDLHGGVRLLRQQRRERAG
jgi:hypothetical protein